jgi:hypothetical protein
MHQDANTSGTLTATVTSSGLTGITQVGTTNRFQGPNGQYLYAFSATGNGTNAAVSVSVNGGTGNNVETTIEVVQLSGNNTTTPIAQSINGTGTSTSATATLTSPNTLNGEVVIAGVHGQATITAPTGYSQLDTQSGTGFANGVYIDSSAQGSSSFGLGSTNVPWGTIAIEINHA